MKIHVNCRDRFDRPELREPVATRTVCKAFFGYTEINLSVKWAVTAEMTSKI